MHILYASDIHANPAHLGALMNRAARPDVDALIVGGDIVPHYLPEASTHGPLEAQALYIENTLLPAIRALKATHPIAVYLDFGNDDFICHRPMLAACEPDLLHLLHMSRHAVTEHLDVLGYMMVPPTPFQRKDWEKPDSADRPHAPGARVTLDGYRTAKGRLEPVRLDLRTDDTIERDLGVLEHKISRPFIFVCHTPPYDTPLDVIHSGHHVGSNSVRQFIQRWADKGLLKTALHGHIHESFRRSGTIQTHVGHALCLNPGQEAAPGAALRYVVLKVENDTPHLRIRLITERKKQCHNNTTPKTS